MLKKGFTTGSAACAASLAALFELYKTPASSVSILLPDSSFLYIPVTKINGVAGVIKDAGDDPDVTNKIFIYADIKLRTDGAVNIIGGKGVGIVTKPGLQLPVGEAAINPAPRKMIEENLRRFLPAGTGADVVINVPEGEKVAKKTFNSRLGIVGGISIIGTTGIVEPRSVDAVIDSIKCEIDVYNAEGADIIWLTPGKIGERALHGVLSGVKTVQMSNYPGEAFQYLRMRGYTKAGVGGHPGKLAKLACGVKNTHSKNSAQANDYIEQLFGLTFKINTIEEVCLPEYGKKFHRLAAEISSKVAEDYGFSEVKVLLFNMAGTLLNK